MRKFTFEQVDAFVAVVEAGSFSAAARLLRKDKSSIHQLVSYLEIELGIELFNREKKLPRLRPEAKNIYNYSKLLLEQHKEIQSLADNLFHGIENSLTISYDVVIPHQVIVDISSHQNSHHHKFTGYAKTKQQLLMH
ncbi:LysR family transcriptional regulator [uncultured Photobacterium sp.]|uniref:LysR family transcriptional regulator n=1 Tax=uncultured Photobacterium sp. TaxID=173973 RepID=UPI0026099F6F|nr:LysR family transcriptional regulator [uncultured Photobacterium sp.]